jgi:thioesterase domain-containing protein/acyl carrier protein
MLPTAYVILKELPLTPNGKIDRGSLPAPDQTRSELNNGFVAPRDDLELQLVDIWQEVLGIRPIGVRDNFFELGGHSLMAVRLLAQVEERLGERLPLSIIFQGATVEHLASVLRQRAWEKLPPVIVPIQPGGTRTPLFFVHAAGGHVFSYTALARSLGPDQPFYGLQARSVGDKHDFRADIESMAADYIEAIRSVQREGPYLLGGWSLGGLIAFEMARQLLQQGQQVALLVMVDAYLPGLISRLHRRFVKERQRDKILILSQHLGIPYDRLKGAWTDLIKMEWADQLSYVLDEGKRSGRLAPNMGLSDVRLLFGLLETHADLIWTYKPQAFEGRATLIRAMSALSMGDAPTKNLISRFILRPLGISSLVRRTVRSLQRRTRGWKRLAAGGLTVYDVPGNHFTMIQEPQVRLLAERLNASIDEAIAEGPDGSATDHRVAKLT